MSQTAARIIPFQSERPYCANPKCNNRVITTSTGRLSIYCADPNCPKQAWYYRKISKEVRAKNEEEARNTAAEVRGLRADLAQAVQLFLFRTPENPAPAQGNTRLSPPSKPLAEADIAAQLELKTASRGDEDPNANFRISMALLQTDNNPARAVEYLTAKDIAYGIERGKLPESVRLTKAIKSTPPTTKGKGNAKPLAGADIELTPPTDLDDLDLL